MTRSHVAIALLAPLLLSSLVACGSKTATGSTGGASSDAAQGASAGLPGIGKRTKTSGCIWHLPLPDSACTPGAIFPAAGKGDICTPGYSRRVRRVAYSTKRRVYLEYGIPSHKPFQYEVDHLISLELGGSNSIANLWPEPASPRPGFHEKDEVENYLHQQVCDGNMTLARAQILIAGNWISIYRKIHH